MVMVKCFDKHYLPFSPHILVTILFFHDSRFFNLTNKMFTIKDIVQEQFHEIENFFPAPFFNHFMHFIPPPIAKLKYLHGVLRGHSSYKKQSHLFVACPPYDEFKIFPKLYVPLSPINIPIMIRQHIKLCYFPGAISSRKTSPLPLIRCLLLHLILT